MEILNIPMEILNIANTIEGASGVATFVRELNSALNARGVNSCVGSIGGMRLRPHILHIHGLWLEMYHEAAKWAKANGIPVVWSTHGMTAPWSMRHKRWKKSPAWWLYQKRDLQNAVAIHCTTEQEADWNRSLGFNNCFVVPLGTREIFNHVEQVEHAEKRLLFVGRIHPVKGLSNLIRAWSLVQDPTCSTCSTWLKKQWKLRFVGPDEANHLSFLKSEVRSLGLEGSVEFAGPRFGSELSAEYDNCDCLVLPSFTENFGATVVDAMAHGKPCIASTFTPWKELQDRGCGWWVSNEPESLATAIRAMIEVGDDKRRAMGELGRKLVEQKYTWAAVADSMIKLYESVISKA